MNCQNCGANVDGKSFCSQCGTPVVRQPAYQTAPRVIQPQGRPTEVLVLGILGLALGCATGIVGLIFSIIGLSKAKNYIATYGDISNQVRIGRRLSIAGVIVGIFMTILLIVWIGLLVLAVIKIVDEDKDFETRRSTLTEMSMSLNLF